MRRRLDVRRVAPIVTGSVLAGSAILVVGALLGWLSLGLPGNRTGIASVAIALAAYALVFVGSLVALLAYLASTGPPNLQVEITFRFSEPNEPVFAAEPDETFGRLRVQSYRQTEGRVVLSNLSDYAARHPGVRIDLVGCGGITVPPGWEAVAWANQIGPLAIQWDGGADRVVHGQWSRVLPGISAEGLTQLRTEPLPELVVTLAADGYRPTVQRVPVKFLQASDYDAYTSARAQKYGLAMQVEPD